MILNVVKAGGGVPVGIYILTPAGLEGATALALGLLRNADQKELDCYGEEAAAIDATYRAAFTRNLPHTSNAPESFTFEGTATRV